jgi:putative membrane protein
MKTIRRLTLALALILAALFVIFNWPWGHSEENPLVTFWPGENGIKFRWPVGFITLVFFLLGFAPMWFINRTNLWRLNRRIASLENSLRITATADSPSGEETLETKDQTSTEEPNEP